MSERPTGSGNDSAATGAFLALRTTFRKVILKSDFGPAAVLLCVHADSITPSGRSQHNLYVLRFNAESVKTGMPARGDVVLGHKLDLV
jgi:hypothetical protein